MTKHILLKSLLAGVLAFGSAMTVEAQTLSVEDFCDIKKSSPARIKDMRPLSGGQEYAAVSDDGRSIEKFSYKTGQKTGVLFSLDNVKGELKIDKFNGYSISANGRKILLWNNVEKLYRRSFYASFYVYDVMRSTLTCVNKKGHLRGAILSHDGRMVAYTLDNNIRLANLDYGTDIAVTTDGELNKVIYGVPDWGYEEEFGIDNTMRFSPDDQTLSFIRFDESKVPQYSFDLYSNFCEPMPEYEYYPGSFDYKYPLAGYNNSVVQVQTYNIDNRTVKTMDLGLGEKDYVPSLEYGGAPDRLMVMVLNRDQNHLRLYKVNPASTVAHQIYEDRSEAWLSPAAYQMVRYRNDAFVIGSERSGYRHLYEYNYAGTLLRTVTSGDYNVTALYGYEPKSRAYYLQCTKNGPKNRNVARADGKGLTLLNPGTGTESARFSETMEYFVRTYSNASTPPQYTLCNARGKQLAELEMNREYAARYASAPRKEFLKVKNAAGEEMEAFVIKPANFDPSRQYPLLMQQYNGPDSQEVLDAWKLDGLFWLAQEGYIIATVDGRGTGNRSRAWANAVYKQLGKYETEDQLAAARYFASQPYIDANRTACFGWSYGGYMSLMELTAPDSPFKCGVAMAPVTDWRYYDAIYTERYMLTPQQNEAGYDQASTLLRTDNLKARLLIMSGTADDNVHFYNTLRFTSKLTQEGKLFDMMAYTGFEHSLRMCNARTMLYRKIKDFLDLNFK